MANPTSIFLQSLQRRMALPDIAQTDVVVRFERLVLGTPWSVFELKDGRVFWVHETTGKVLESSRTRKE